MVSLVVVSCTTAAETTTTNSGRTTTSLPPVTTTTIDPALLLPLPRDNDILLGTLDNGLTYYVRRNDSPGGRAELRLVVNAGSVLEDPDQAGMAHFLEHMMFNGTERFPRNDLTEVLESFGPRFGPDINAYTSFDETVYELNVRTDDDELVDLAFDVLREWASRATLTEADVTEERGVVLDEWRLRAQGYQARVNDVLLELVFQGTAYEDHLPIGNPESIRATSPPELRRFYDDWYVPERMAVVAVGDFNLSDIEDLIVDNFGDLPAADNVRSFELPSYAPPGEPRLASFVDEEATSAGVTVLWPMPRDALVTAGDYQRLVARSLGFQILSDRLDEDAFIEDSPLTASTRIDLAWTRSIGAAGVDVELRPERADDGLAHVLTEVERLRRHGITDDEFARVTTSFSAVSRQLVDRADSIQDAELASQIVAHFLAGQPLMSPVQRFQIEQDLLERITPADIEAALSAVVDQEPVLLTVGPDDEGLIIPTRERIAELLAELAVADIGPRQEVATDRTDLMPRPDPVEIAAITVHPQFGYRTLEFENGAVVSLWASDIAVEGVLVLAQGFGGTSVVDVADLTEAELMIDIVNRSGAGDFSSPELTRALAGRLVQVFPWISETRHGLTGEASSKDVETLMQLIHLTLTEARFDRMVVDNVLQEVSTLNASKSEVPDILFSEALNQGYYGDDPRYWVVPPQAEVDIFDLERAMELYASTFGDAGRLAFAFVGDFNVEEMSSLAASYIGTLPGTPVDETFVDNQPLPPRSVQVFTVEAGQGEQAAIGMFFTNPMEATLEDRVTARLVELILNARLRNRIREELSATYSISAGIDLQQDPDPFAEASINSGGDPTDLQRISDEVVADIADLQANGPTESQFGTAVRQMRNELELFDNLMLAEALITNYLYPDRPTTELTDRLTVLEEITPDDVARLASIVFNLGQRIEVRQVPKT